MVAGIVFSEAVGGLVMLLLTASCFGKVNRGLLINSAYSGDAICWTYKFQRSSPRFNISNDGLSRCVIDRKRK